jgi:tetraacyldisaccharide 4'-kinase
MILAPVVHLRNWLYDSGLFQVTRLPVPVISVGNITFGGTGKTPVILHLLRELQDLGISAGVVSRGYGRKTRGPLEVLTSGPTSGPDAARTFGDEPVLVKRYFPNVPFFVGEARVDAAQALLVRNKVQVILADDAFQHRRLWRDLDIVLVDATERDAHRQLFPFGRGREPESALGRAQIVLITRSNSVSPDRVDTLKGMIRLRAPGARCWSVRFHVRPANGTQGEPVFLFSGLGRNDEFFSSAKSVLEVVGERGFPDHHYYSKQELLDLRDEAVRVGATRLVTTEKDLIKIDVNAVNIPIETLGLDTEIEGEGGDLKGILRGLVR